MAQGLQSALSSPLNRIHQVYSYQTDCRSAFSEADYAMEKNRLRNVLVSSAGQRRGVAEGRADYDEKHRKHVRGQQLEDSEAGGTVHG